MKNEDDSQNKNQQIASVEEAISNHVLKVLSENCDEEDGDSAVPNEKAGAFIGGLSGIVAGGVAGIVLGSITGAITSGTGVFSGGLKGLFTGLLSGAAIGGIAGALVERKPKPKPLWPDDESDAEAPSLVSN